MMLFIMDGLAVGVFSKFLQIKLNGTTAIASISWADSNEPVNGVVALHCNSWLFDRSHCLRGLVHLLCDSMIGISMIMVFLQIFQRQLALFTKKILHIGWLINYEKSELISNSGFQIHQTPLHKATSSVQAAQTDNGRHFCSEPLH